MIRSCPAFLCRFQTRSAQVTLKFYGATFDSCWATKCDTVVQAPNDCQDHSATHRDNATPTATTASFPRAVRRQRAAPRRSPSSLDSGAAALAPTAGAFPCPRLYDDRPRGDRVPSCHWRAEGGCCRRRVAAPRGPTATAPPARPPPPPPPDALRRARRRPRRGRVVRVWARGVG